MSRRRRRLRLPLAVVAVGVAASAALHALDGPDPLAVQQDTANRIERTIGTAPTSTTSAGHIATNSSDRPGGERK